MKKNILGALLLATPIFFFACKKVTTEEVTTISGNEASTFSITANTYYVNGNFNGGTPIGDNNRSALEAQNPSTPWRTIQKAANTIPGGSIVIIAGGTYFERVSLPSTCNGPSSGNPTIFKSADNETAVLDGQWNRSTFEQYASQFKLTNNENITIIGIKVKKCAWYGFNVNGTSPNACKNITFEKCSSDTSGASGIYVQNSTFININKCNIRMACLWPTRSSEGYGTQECISLASCNNFNVTNNSVTDNLTTDAGGEGIDAKGNISNGVISGNYVYKIGRAAIYVDAGSILAKDVRVFNNIVDRCAAGIVMAGEMGGNLRDIYIYNNIIRENLGCGIVVNGPLDDYTAGTVKNIHIAHNTFYNNATRVGNNWTGEIANFANNTQNDSIFIRNNVFYNKTTTYNFSIYVNQPNKHYIDHNLFFDFKQRYSYGGFTQTGSTDINANPAFVPPVGYSLDFHLTSSSPAIATGFDFSNSTIPRIDTMFKKDFGGKTRGGLIQGTNNHRYDMGAYQYVL